LKLIVQESILICTSLIFLSMQILLMQIFQLTFNRLNAITIKRLDLLLENSKKLCVLSHMLPMFCYIPHSSCLVSNISQVDFLVAERDVLRYFCVRFLHWKSLLQSLLFAAREISQVSSIEMYLHLLTVKFFYHHREKSRNWKFRLQIINKFMVNLYYG